MKWNKNKNGCQRELPPFLLDYLIRLNGKLLQLGSSLQKKTMTYSKGRLKALLVLFCLLFSSVSIWVIISSIHDKGDSFTVTPIRAIPLIKSEQSKLKPIKEVKWKPIQQINGFPDSLIKKDIEKSAYSPFLLLHLHLKDSIHLLEHLYYEQHYSNNYGK